MARKPSYKLVRSGLEGVRDDYTAIFIASGTAGYEEIARRMVRDTPHISAESALQAVKAFFYETADRIGGDAERVNHEGFAFAPAIRGSLLHADADLAPENEVFVNVIVSEGLLAQLQAIPLQRDATPGNFRFDRVIDVAANEAGLVTAGAETVLTGDLMSIGAEDESVTVTDGEGTVRGIAATAERHGCSLRFDAPAGLAAGRGSVAVTSRGLLTPDAKPETIRRAVTIRPATKKRVVLSNGSVDGSAVFFEAENPEGVRDYMNDGITEEYSVDLWKNGELVEEDAHVIHVLGSGSPYVEHADFAEAGDTVKVVAHVDPAKTEFDPRDAVLEFTVA